MKAVLYGLLADVDVSSYPHVPSNDAARGCSCLQGLSFNETIFTCVCLFRSTRFASFLDPPSGCVALNQSDNDRDGCLATSRLVTPSWNHATARALSKLLNFRRGGIVRCGLLLVECLLIKPSK